MNSHIGMCTLEISGGHSKAADSFSSHESILRCMSAMQLMSAGLAALFSSANNNIFAVDEQRVLWTMHAFAISCHGSIPDPAEDSLPCRHCLRNRQGCVGKDIIPTVWA